MDCFSLTDLDYETFRDDLNLKVGKQRVPLMASVELTMGCNLRCKHCYVPMSERAGNKQGELTVAEFDHIFTEFAEEGWLWLLLTGGEPFDRTDFLEIYDLAKSKGFILSLFTNGTLLTEEIVDHLAEYRPFNIEITLYGATQQTYEHVTGVPGSYARCMRGIELILSRNLPLKLKTMVLTINQHELGQMKRFSESLVVDFRYNTIINPGIDASLQPINYRLSAVQILEIESQDLKMTEALHVDIEKNLSRVFDRSQKYNCTAGLGGFHMDAFGRASLCMSAREPDYHLRKGSFKDCWQNFLPKAREGEVSPDFECRDCKLRSICAQCAGWAMLEYKDTESKIPFLCDLTNLRFNSYIKSRESA